jgi:glycine C-acetyltransferase
VIGEVRGQLADELAEVEAAGTFKSEREITSPQGAHITIAGRGDRTIVNLCANDYLGLANHPDVRAAARAALDRWGFGVASVRFICGTQQLHQELESAITGFLGTEATILYPSCFDANGGLFETLLGDRDAVISDALNHASIIDGIRLCKAMRLRYSNGDMAELEARLQEARGARRTLIVTDGVFSMDGYIADLPAICDLAERYGALVMVDDSHGVGVLGARGRGTPEHHGVTERIDILTGTLGKALGGGGGGYTSGRREIVQLLRQRSRPYLFSNSITPAVAAGSLRAIEMLSASTELRDRLGSNARLFRALMAETGVDALAGEHPIVPVMIGDEQRLAPITTAAFEEGLHVVGFSYPVVPLGTARIRTQVSAAHSEDDLRLAADVFARVAAHDAA